MSESQENDVRVCIQCGCEGEAGDDGWRAVEFGDECPECAPASAAADEAQAGSYADSDLLQFVARSFVGSG